MGIVSKAPARPGAGEPGLMRRRLSDAMEAHGYSVRSLASVTGLSERAIWKMLTGESLPGSTSIVRLSLALGVSADWLLGLEDAPPGAEDDG